MDIATNKTLLFAEDEPELLEIYTEWHKRLGYNVLGASNGVEALSLCRAHNVDLIISDVRMAGGDGVRLAQQLKTNFDRSPLLVFLTGYADLPSEEAYDLGACAILQKPINRQELQRAISRFLQPPRKLWSTPVTFEHKALFEKSYESLASALQNRALSFGRGGVFIRHCDAMLEDVPVGFKVQFTESREPRINGCGIVRWQRAVSQQNLPAGVGIEILQLDEQCIESVVGCISRANPRSFIPRQ